MQLSDVTRLQIRPIYHRPASPSDLPIDVRLLLLLIHPIIYSHISACCTIVLIFYRCCTKHCAGVQVCLLYIYILFILSLKNDQMLRMYDAEKRSAVLENAAGFAGLDSPA